MTLDLPSSYEQPESKFNVDSSWTKIFSILDPKQKHKKIIDDRPLGERVREQRKNRGEGNNEESEGGSEVDNTSGTDGFNSSEDSNSFGKRMMKSNPKQEKREQRENQRLDNKREKRRENSRKKRIQQEEEQEREENGWEPKQEEKPRNHKLGKQREKRNRQDMEENGWISKADGLEKEMVLQNMKDEIETPYIKQEIETPSQPEKKKRKQEKFHPNGNGKPYEVINVYEEQKKMKKEIQKKYEGADFEEEVKRKLIPENPDQIEDDSIAFGTFDFSAGRPLPLYLAKRKSQIVPLSTKIKLAKKREKALAEEGKGGDNLREFHQWKNVMDKENGLKLKDSSTHLKKAMKSVKKRKNKHREEWSKREQDQKDNIEAKQKKRERNLKKRKDMNLERKVNRRWGIKTKSKTLRPGFEGRKKHFINK